MADLNGTGSNTLGNWVTGTNHTIINGSKSIGASLAPSGYPTVNVICPKDKKVKYDLWNDKTLAAMEATVKKWILDCKTVSIEEAELSGFYLSMYPSPAESNATLSVISNQSEQVNIEIYNAMGQLMSSKQTELLSGENSINLNLEEFAAGSYFVKIIGSKNFSKTLPFVKQ